MMPAERNPFLPLSSDSERAPETLRSVELPQSGVRSQPSPASRTESMPPLSSVVPWDLMTDEEDTPTTLRSGSVPIVDRSTDRYRESAVMKHEREDREKIALSKAIETTAEIEKIFRNMYSGDFNRWALVKKANFVDQITKGCSDVRLVKLHEAIEIVLTYLRARSLSTPKLVAAKNAVTRWLDDMEKEEGQEMLRQEVDAMCVRQIREEINELVPDAQRASVDDESQYPSQGVL